MSKSIKSKLFDITAKADATRKYQWAVDIFERYNKEYNFDLNLKYKLGLLYDHLAIIKSSKIKNQRRREMFMRKYLGKAESIYREILKEEKNNLLAFRGLARVYEAQGKYREAIQHALRSYRIMSKLPKNKRGPLGIGSFYESVGDKKKAEEWYKKELTLLGKNDIGANANLMNFYRRIDKFENALPYAEKSERLLLKIFSIHSSSDRTELMKQNQTIRFLFNSIDEVKSRIRSRAR